MVASPPLPGITVKATSWFHPPSILEVKDGAVRDTGAGAPPTTDRGDFVAEEIWATAEDGTRIPISILRSSALKKTGDAPTILFGYGAYGQAFLPDFFPTRLAWLERGGIFAIAHLRGGGELGEAWHRAGSGANKMTAVRDFVACGKELVSSGYTRAQRLGAQGGSAGGVVLARAITIAPDLFRAVFIEAGLVNPLRHEARPNGAASVVEFGSVATANGFSALYETDAYQHVVDGTPYPAVLLATGANDARVPAWQSAKLVARLQQAQKGGGTALLRVDFEDGHDIARRSASHEVDVKVDSYAFLAWQLGLGK
jgi:prolyl oligopeptidase